MDLYCLHWSLKGSGNGIYFTYNFLLTKSDIEEMFLYFCEFYTKYLLVIANNKENPVASLSKINDLIHFKYSLAKISHNSRVSPSHSWNLLQLKGTLEKAQSIIAHHPSNIQQVKTKCYRAAPESTVAQ